MNRITFKKNPRYSGRMRCAETYSVSLNGKRVATIQRIGGDDYEAWFWYGFSVNTCNTPKTLNQVKSDVKSHIRNLIEDKVLGL